jgi:hypothetical protein
VQFIFGKDVECETVWKVLKCQLKLETKRKFASKSETNFLRFWRCSTECYTLFKDAKSQQFFHPCLATESSKNWVLQVKLASLLAQKNSSKCHAFNTRKIINFKNQRKTKNT